MRKIFKRKETREEVVVDWNFYCNADEQTRSQLNDLLIAIGIFSCKIGGNWELTDGSIVLKPDIASCTPLNFTRKEDAICFARIKYGEVVYSWEIRRISEVIKRDQI